VAPSQNDSDDSASTHGIMTLRINDTEHNGTQHIDTLHYNTLHYSTLHTTSVVVFPVMLPALSKLARLRLKLPIID
jgi:hypothetical protein